MVNSVAGGIAPSRRELLLGAVAAAAAPHAFSKSVGNDFDAYVRASMVRWGVPGVAIATVTNGNRATASGYGEKADGGGTAVGAGTVFAIASLTKAFTAATLATLIDEGKLGWDDPVAKHIPELKLYDSTVTSTVTVRDLLKQRTCLQPKDLFTWGSPFSKDELIRRLQFLPLVCKFRSEFVYNNLNYVLAGEVAARAGGGTWEELVDTRILKPLGMTSSTPWTAKAASASDVATPHIKTGRQLRKLKLYDEGVSAPAGSIHTSAENMTRWLETCLGGGKFRGKTIWTPESHRQIFGPEEPAEAPQTTPAGPPLPQSIDYSCGWGKGRYRGRHYFEHTGQSDGMYALMALLPGMGSGIAVMTNTSMVGLPQALAYRWLDDQLGLPKFDWASVLFEQSKAQNDSIDIDNAVRDVPGKAGTKPSLPLSRYTGVYRNDLLGDAVLTEPAPGQLSIKILARTGTLKHWDDEKFQIDWGGDPYYTMVASFLTFTVDAQKHAVSMAFGAENDVFSRQ